jgi:dTMP kinase
MDDGLEIPYRDTQSFKDDKQFAKFIELSSSNIDDAAMQGRLIVFEGVEGSGKTTQISRSQSWLEHSELIQHLKAKGLISHTLVTREPGGTDIGQEIRHLLLTPTSQEPVYSQTELLLYAADRAQHVEHMLRPQLAAGALILCDRYTDSTMAYQGYGRGLSRSLIHQLNEIATQGLESDLTLWFDLEVEQGLARTQKRGSADRIEQSGLAFHQRVRQGFQELAAAYPHRIVRIDAAAELENVTHQVQTQVLQALQRWYL